MWIDTPIPYFSIGYGYSPYSRLATDPVTFSCSFAYSTNTLQSVTWANLEFKFGSLSTIQTSDITVATVMWGSDFSSPLSNFSSQVATAYSSRISNLIKVSDNGTFKNMSFTLGVNGSTYSPNYYTLSDVGYYYCQLYDSTGGSTFSPSVELFAYCMI